MKTLCIYHSRDLDGWMSAAIVKHWHFNKPDKKQYGIGGQQVPIDDINFLGWDYGNEIPDVSGYDQVIMCDISFPTEEMFKLHTRLIDNFIWIDHHISTIKSMTVYYQEDRRFERYGLPKGLRDTAFVACELTWKHFFPTDPMPEIVRLLGRYDCFGHKGTDEEQKVLEFQYGARQLISNYEDAYGYLLKCMQDKNGVQVTCNDILDKGKVIYQYLCTEAKQTYAKAFPITLQEKVYDDGVKVGVTFRKFLCVNQDRFNPVNFDVDYHKDGYDGFACFWLKDGKWHFSLYNDNGEVDCSAIAKSFGGGGHKGAAGFVTDDINAILKEVSNEN